MVKNKIKLIPMSDSFHENNKVLCVNKKLTPDLELLDYLIVININCEYELHCIYQLSTVCLNCTNIII